MTAHCTKGGCLLLLCYFAKVALPSGFRVVEHFRRVAESSNFTPGEASEHTTYFTRCSAGQDSEQYFKMIVGKRTVPPKDLPEMELFHRLKKKGFDKLEYNSGIAFPGGGGRAYPLALGAYKALHGLGLLKNARYTVCSSASCWATALYTFTKYGDDYFPEVKDPKNWTLEDVAGPSDKSEGYKSRNGRGLFKITSSFGKRFDLGQALGSEGPWPAWNARHIFKYAGINTGDVIAADEEHAKYLRERLATMKWKGNVVPPRSAEFPYWIAGITILGLKKLMPFVDPHSFQYMDASSLYVGPLHSHREKYKSGNGRKHDVEEWTSGILETIAFGNSYDKGDPTWNGSIQGHHGAMQATDSIKGCLKVNVKKPSRLLDMLSAASAAPAGVLSMVSAGSLVMPYRKYVSINAEPPYDPRVHKWYFGDTGNAANVALYSLLQRKAQCGLVYVSPWSPLDIAWAREYINRPDDPSNSPVIDDVGPQIDWSLAAFFGVKMANAEEKGCGSGWLGCTLDFHQVFETRHLKDLVSAFVAAYDGGKAMIHAMNLTTIGNDRWGIAAGHHIRVTFVYLSVPKQWEDDVQLAMRRIYKKPDWTWKKDLKCRGKTFEQYYNQKIGFPSAPSLLGTFKPMCPLFASLFYQLAASVVVDNQQIIRNALEHETCRVDDVKQIGTSSEAGAPWELTVQGDHVNEPP